MTSRAVAVLVAALAPGILPARAQVSKIVGLGAAPCSRVLADIAADPSVERGYFAWGQGFMSGALMRAPPGVDEGLDLLPPDFSMPTQVAFLRAYCTIHPEEDYTDAVHALYQRLKKART